MTVFSLPFAFVAVDDGRVSWLAWAGGALAAAAIAGEVVADRQLAAWRADPGQQRHDLPRGALGALPPPQLLLRVAALGRLGR